MILIKPKFTHLEKKLEKPDIEKLTLSYHLPHYPPKLIYRIYIVESCSDIYKLTPSYHLPHYPPKRIYTTYIDDSHSVNIHLRMHKKEKKRNEKSIN